MNNNARAFVKRFQVYMTIAVAALLLLIGGMVLIPGGMDDRDTDAI